MYLSFFTPPLLLPFPLSDRVKSLLRSHHCEAYSRSLTLSPSPCVSLPYLPSSLFLPSHSTSVPTPALFEPFLSLSLSHTHTLIHAHTHPHPPTPPPTTTPTHPHTQTHILQDMPHQHNPTSVLTTTYNGY